MTDAIWKSYEQYRELIEQANRLNKEVIFDALDGTGITVITAAFDGEGDSGQLDPPIAMAGDQPACFPEKTLVLHEARYGSNSLTAGETTLAQAVENLCYDYLEQKCDGWENNDGAYGAFTIDVARRTIDLEFNGRFTDV